MNLGNILVNAQELLKYVYSYKWEFFSIVYCLNDEYMMDIN